MVKRVNFGDKDCPVAVAVYAGSILTPNLEPDSADGDSSAAEKFRRIAVPGSGVPVRTEREGWV